jgi:hypothetical protein
MKTRRAAATMSRGDDFQPPALTWAATFTLLCFLLALISWWLLRPHLQAIRRRRAAINEVRCLLSLKSLNDVRRRLSGILERDLDASIRFFQLLRQALQQNKVIAGCKPTMTRQGVNNVVVLVLVGPPGAGKSTLAAALGTHCEAAGVAFETLSFDAFRQRQGSSCTWSGFADAVTSAVTRAASSCAVGSLLVIDSCAVTRRKRLDLALAARVGERNGAQLVACAYTIPAGVTRGTLLDELCRRVAQRAATEKARTEESDSAETTTVRRIDQLPPTGRRRLLASEWLGAEEMPSALSEPLLDDVVEVNALETTAQAARRVMAALPLRAGDCTVAPCKLRAGRC